MYKDVPDKIATAGLPEGHDNAFDGLVVLSLIMHGCEYPGTGLIITVYYYEENLWK